MVAQKFHFAILRIEVTRASRGLSAIAELLVLTAADCFIKRYIEQESEILPTVRVFGRTGSIFRV